MENVTVLEVIGSAGPPDAIIDWVAPAATVAKAAVPTAPSNNDYQPGFAVDMMLKDLRLAQQAAEFVNLDTEFGAKALMAYETLSEQGHGGRDFSVVMKKLKNEL